MKRANVIVAAGIAITVATALAVSAVYVDDGGEGNVGGAGVSDAAAPDLGRLASFVVHETPKEAPEVSFATAEGAARTLADWRGKAVLLNLWATWCAPCRDEMPSLDRLQAKLGSDAFEVVAVSLDRGGVAKPKAFYEEIAIENLTLYIDETGRLGSALSAVGMPTTILFDAEGREVGRMAGPAEWDSEAAIELIRKAVEAKS